MVIKPYQIDELKVVHGNITLDALKAAVLAGKPYDCPQCDVVGRIQVGSQGGLIPIMDECPTCEGWGKTPTLKVAQAVQVVYVDAPPDEG